MTREPRPDALDATTRHVRRAVAGDDESVGWLVERLHPLLRAHARFRLGPGLRAHHDPEDLVQDAWMVALHRLGDLQERNGRLTPVLLRFLSTTILYRVNELTRAHLRHGHDGSDALRSGLAATDASGAVTKAIRRETRDLVGEAIDTLDERDREILLLRGIEQQPAGTVGMVLGLKPSAVSMRYRRALERLRAKLPGSVFDEIDEEPADSDE